MTGANNFISRPADLGSGQAVRSAAGYFISAKNSSHNLFSILCPNISPLSENWLWGVCCPPKSLHFHISESWTTCIHLFKIGNLNIFHIQTILAWGDAQIQRKSAWSRSGAVLARTECDRERWADAANAKYLARLGHGPPYLKITPDSSIKRLS